MDFLIELGLFVSKAAIIVTAFIVIIGAIVSTVHRHKPSEEGHIVVTDISTKFKELHEGMLEEVMDEKDFKNYKKSSKKEQKQADKAKQKAQKKSKNDSNPSASPEQNENIDKSSEETVSRTFVIDFDGGENAEEVECLREEISAILTIATEKDEVLLRLESPGGVVHGYGHAASQLQRLTDKKVKLIASIDEVAASGGYMMACVADEIISAPFAIVGSIGVIAELPNFNRLLKKFDVDIEQHTAGEFKRTLTILGQNTDKGREKFKEELDEAHDLFKQWVSTHREQLEIDKVATGEHWFGQQALDLKLVDKLGTSDDYLMAKAADGHVFEVKFELPKQLSSRLSRILQGAVEGVIFSGLKQLRRSRFSKRL